MAGGIIRMDNDNAAAARRDRRIEGVKVDLPAVVVNERVANQAHVLNVCEKIEKRIAGSGDQDFVTWIAEKTKDEGIGFAGAGGQQNVVGWHRVAASRVVAGDCFACREKSSWFWLVGEGTRIREGCENFLVRVGEAAFDGVRSSQIDQRLTGEAMARERFAQAIRREIPVRSVCKQIQASP